MIIRLNLAVLMFDIYKYNTCITLYVSSALLYLGDEFEGGDFFFAHRNLSIQVGLIVSQRLFTAWRN